MLGLPIQTEVKKQLPKSAIYTKFQMNNAQKERIDSDISKLVIVNEILPSTINIAAGENIKAFYVVNVLLKNKKYDEKNIAKISKLIPQNILFVLEFENEIQLAIYHTKLIHTEWLPKDDTKIILKGLDLDSIWENLVKSIAFDNEKLEMWNEKLSLTENIVADDKKAKLEKEIARLERQARNEKQPKKKFELVQQINKLKNEMESKI